MGFFAQVPQARAELARMREVSPEWAVLVEAWDELERLYAEDLKDQGVRTSDRMRSLQGRPARRSGP